MKKFDVIIIGSGIGGLSAGAILSKKGKKVLVLEKHFLPGGYATNFRRGKFEFDSSLHQISNFEKTGFLNVIKKCGILKKINFIKHKFLFEAKFPDFKIAFKNGNTQDFRQKLEKQFPKEKWRIRLWFFLLWKLGREVYWWDKFIKFRKIAFPMIYFAPFLIPLLILSDKFSLKKILDFCGRNKKLRAVLRQLLGYFSSNEKISYQFFAIPNYSYFFSGGIYPRGGAQCLSNALVEVIQNSKGQVLCNNEVDKILVENNQSIGIKTVSGDEFLAKKIIANANPFLVYENFLSHWPRAKKELDKIKKMEIGTSLSQIFIGLKCPIETLNPIFQNSYNFFVNGSYELNIPQNFSIEYQNFVLIFPTNIEPNFAPKNKSTVQITFVDNYDRWQSLSKKDYIKQKKIELNKILQKVENFLPNLRQNIEMCEFATPLTMERFTGNPKGAVYGFSQKVGQSGFSRFDLNSPLKNLYFASAWSQPGGGIEGVMRAGERVARKIN